MSKSVLIISGSPKKDGNTAALVDWFVQGAASKGASTEVVRAASLGFKVNGCLSCRICQKNKEYTCMVGDDVRDVLGKMPAADVIVFATPLYFFGPSAQTKLVFDRMFSLYKWNNQANTMETPLKGKTLAVIASAYEDVGLDALEKPFRLTADYTGMKFFSLLIPNAGISGDIRKLPAAQSLAFAFGQKLAE